MSTVTVWKFLTAQMDRLNLTSSYSLNCKGGEIQPLVKFEFRAHRMKFAQKYIMIHISQSEQFHILLKYVHDKCLFGSACLVWIRPLGLDFTDVL